jgi:hypothetical protein
MIQLERVVIYTYQRQTPILHIKTLAGRGSNSSARNSGLVQSPVTLVSRSSAIVLLSTELCPVDSVTHVTTHARIQVQARRA